RAPRVRPHRAAASRRARCSPRSRWWRRTGAAAARRPPAPSRRRSGAASRPAPSWEGRCRRSRSRALSRSVALLARVLRDRGARLLDQRGPVDALLLDLAHPALDDRLELLAERGELLVGQ